MIAPQARFLEFLPRARAALPALPPRLPRQRPRARSRRTARSRACATRTSDGTVHEVRAPPHGGRRRPRQPHGASWPASSPSGRRREMDVVWLRLPKKDGDPPTRARCTAATGGSWSCSTATSEWQAGYVIAKGGYKQLHEAGHRAAAAERGRGWCRGSRTASARSTTGRRRTCSRSRANRLPLWHKPGLLFIGDAAHAMSPVGGVGINYAIGDAVEAANVLVGEAARGAADRGGRSGRGPAAARAGRCAGSSASRVVIQERIVGERCGTGKQFVPPCRCAALEDPHLRDIPARMVAFGPRPYRLERADEHPPAS